MRYTRWEDVVARYPIAAGKSNANPAENFELSYGQPAEAEVDAYLARRYTVPVANTPDLTPFLVRDVSTDLAYLKMSWFGMDKDKEKVLRDSIYSRLAALSCGSLMLVGSGGIVVQAVGTVWGSHQSKPNVSGMDPVENWQTSTSELLDEESRRDA